ncbi:CdaR family transcriptional regulator [Virgibacillus kekensis]|uniref:CdaR family transcriptional regulator n=1 Tax=Virgibacillus kekensis TaxID=202261 RepID=A0ABV9DHD2_9BACI
MWYGGFVQFAQSTVKAVSGIISFPISVSNEKGYIIGDTNPERIGTRHKPSIEVIRKNDVTLFTREKVAGMENVLPGVAAPLNFGGRPVGVLGIIGEPELVEPYAHLVKKYVEMMWQETLHVQAENLESMTLESFFQYILLNKSVNREQVNHYCDMLKIRADCTRFCIIVDIGNALLENIRHTSNSLKPNRFKGTLLDCVKRAFDHGNDDICAFLNTERIVVLKAVRDETRYLEYMREFKGKCLGLIETLKMYSVELTTIGAGNPYSSIDMLSRSYLDADSVMKYGQQWNGGRKVFSYYDWDILLGMLPSRIDPHMRKTLITRLEAFRKDSSYMELKHDFLVYCEHSMNISRAAKALYIHRNTLIYRLKKVNELTGLDTSRFDHCTLLYFSLREETENLSQQHFHRMFE